jgi:hypothetical protein
MRINDVQIKPDASQGWSVVGTGDFNGDGQLDILWYDETDGKLSSWYMSGPFVVRNDLFPTKCNMPASTGWHISGTGDFDNDGYSDILRENRNTGELEFWSMAEFWSFATLSCDTRVAIFSHFDSSSREEWGIAGTGDFNNDGYSDILWHNLLTGTLRYSYMGETGNWRDVDLDSTYNRPKASGWRIAGTNDYDRDGYCDILWHNESTGLLSYWYMNDSILRKSEVITPSGSPGWRIVSE